MEMWFSSDFHLGHKNIIEYDERPFDNVKQMDEELIKNINNRIARQDRLYFLGDFSFRQNPIVYRERINCSNVVMIMGNHDHHVSVTQYQKCFESVHEILIAKVNNLKLVLCHYPIESWPMQKYGSIHLHGHCHGRSRFMINRIDVGVDCHHYCPLHTVDVEEIIKGRINAIGT